MSYQVQEPARAFPISPTSFPQKDKKKGCGGFGKKKGATS